MTSSIERRLRKLEEAGSNGGWPKHFTTAFFSDGEDGAAAERQAEALYRAEHALPESEPVGVIAIDFVLPEWAANQREKGLMV
jgi:hypothetical protein